jgi:hypothetical protein
MHTESTAYSPFRLRTAYGAVGIELSSFAQAVQKTDDIPQKAGGATQEGNMHAYLQELSRLAAHAHGDIALAVAHCENRIFAHFQAYALGYRAAAEALELCHDFASQDKIRRIFDL